MSSLLRSSVILAFARFTNYAILVLSPILLVRILDPYAFGQYREFMVYATLVASLATFSIPANLLYFIPHNPEDTRHYVSHTNWLVALTSVVACAVLLLFRQPLLANTSYDFFLPLIIYVVLFINLDFLESFWIATKRADRVLYYSTLRTVARLATVILVAVYTRSVEAILRAIILVEAARIVVALIIMGRLQLLAFDINWTVLRRQLVFIVPLGLAGSLHYINQSIGQIAISTQLGVVALAIYTIGSYQVPILGIVRSSIGDAIFPDMVRQAASADGDRLLLWKRSNVAYSFIIIPVFVVLLWYANVLIPFVFSDRYTESIPLFRVLLLVMLLQCFEFSSPLRALNRNKLLLAGNLLMIAINIAFIAATFRYLREWALFGPAVGLVAGYVAQIAFFGWSVTQAYGITPRSLLKWSSLAKLLMGAATTALLLLAGEYMAMPDLVRVPLFSALFFVSYFLLVRWAKIEEVETVVALGTRKFRNR